MAFRKYDRPKDPDQKLPYGLDFADELASESGGTAMVLSNPTVEAYNLKSKDSDPWVAAPGIVIEDEIVVGQTVRCFVSGGAVGQALLLTFGATRADGGNVVGSMILKIGDR